MICKAPFTSQASWTTGSVSICCNDEPEVEYYDLESEWNSVERIEARTEWLNGTIPNRCVSCIERMNSRDATLPIWYRDVIGDDYEASPIIKTPPIYLHLSPSSECNLACRMCTPNISNTLDKLLCDSSNGTQYVDVVDYVRKCAPTLKHYVFHGGDPMFYRNFVEIVDILLPYRDSLYINVITNGTHHKSNGVDMMAMLAQFKNLKITVSIDSVPKYNDYMRSLTNTNRVYDIYNKWCREVPHAEMAIHTITTNISSLGIVEHLRDVINGNKLDRIDAFSYYMVGYPAIYKVTNLPEPLRVKVTKNIETYLGELELMDKDDEEQPYIINTIDILRNILNLFETTKFDIMQWGDFLRRNKEHDSAVRSGTTITNIISG